MAFVCGDSLVGESVKRSHCLAFCSTDSVAVPPPGSRAIFSICADGGLGTVALVHSDG